MGCCQQTASSQDKNGFGQPPSTRPVRSPCPRCGQAGVPVKPITPQHTLKAIFRQEVDATGDYHFCETPSCDVVYYQSDGTQTFTTSQLIHRVTVKDEHPDTPLCYCFKILKRDVLAEIERTGSADVVAMIQQKMARHGCQCEKLNPRGACCLDDISAWLKQRGAASPEKSPGKAGACGCTSGMATHATPPEETPGQRTTACCGTTAGTTSGGCC